jgi:hypothetical protein
VPELVQSAVTTGELVARIAPLLDRTSEAARSQRAGFAAVRQQLGDAGASSRVAGLAAGLLAE